MSGRCTRVGRRAAIRRLALPLALAALLCCLPRGARAEDAAAEYTRELAVSPVENVVTWTDGNVRTHARLPASMPLPQDGLDKLLYLEFYETPGDYWIVQYDAEGALLSRRRGGGPMLNVSHAIAAEAAELRVLGDGLLANLRLFTAGGALPADVHIWNPTPEKADILLISAHPDDEHLYLGGIMPTYAAERGYAVVVVYMTCGERVRHNEALEGDWRNGIRHYPVFLNYPDKYCETETNALHHWGGREPLVERLMALIDAYRPEVVVTHDIQGEYGHGAHKATASAVREAVERTAADGDAWTVQKLYWHLGQNNPIVMDWRVPLDAFDGQTAFDLARAGYAAHVSQTSQFKLAVRDAGELSCAKYGLEWTLVGPDVQGGDLLENIPPERLSSYVSPTPVPTPVPTPTLTPTRTAVATPAPAAAPEANGFAARRWLMPLGGTLALLAVLGLILYRRAGKKG